MPLLSLLMRLLIGLVLVPVVFFPAWSAPASKVGSTDEYGDLLPTGALSRLGTERLTHAHADLLAFSPDGKLLASAGLDGIVRLWRVDTGKEMRRFQGPLLREQALSVSAVAFSPDGKFIVASFFANGSKPSLYVWDTLTGKEIHRFDDLPGFSARFLAFARDGKTLAASCNETAVFLDPVAGAEIGRGGTHYGDTPVAFADEGKALLSLTQKLEGKSRVWVVRRWDVAGGKELSHYELEPVNYRFSPSPDGKIIAAPTKDGKVIRMLDAATGKELRRTEEGDAKPIFHTFTSDGSLFAATGTDGMIRVYETATAKLRHEFRGHKAYVQGFALSPDGKLLATTASRQDDAIHVWDMAQGKELHSFMGHRSGPLVVAFLPDGKTVATVSRDSSHTMPISDWADWSLRLWDAKSGKELRAEKASQGGEIHKTAVSPDGRLLATVRYDGTLRLWDVAETKVTQEWKIPTADSKIKYPDREILVPHPDLTALAFAPDNKVLVTAGEQNILRFWDVKTGKELRNEKLAANLVASEAISADGGTLAFSPDGKALAYCVEDKWEKAVVLSDAATLKEKSRLPSVRGFIGSLAFSNDGKEIAVIVDTSLFVGEVDSGTIRVKYSGLPLYSRGLAFAPDGRTVVTSGRDGVIRFWQGDADKPVRTFTEQPGWVDRLVFSPDGKMLASAGTGNTAYVWNVADK